MPKKSKRQRIASNFDWRGAFASLAILLVLTNCAKHPSESARNEYAGARSCAACHREIAEAYGKTGMGRSFSRPGAAVIPSHVSFDHKLSGRRYEIDARDGKFYQSRRQPGYGGKETNAIERQIDFVVGSGDHARTFLHRNPDGQLTELPLSWYGEKSGHWGMSPGYDNAHPEDFRRPAPDECLFCHNAYPLNGAIPEGIDCQRCHGPGRAHVESSGRISIVNPARLDRDRQLDVCMQCHLETTSLPLPNAIRRYGRTAFSYRAGEPLTDYELFFDHAPNTGYDDRFEVAHQAYRLRKSACFLKSKMTCTTCHDPHRPQAAEHFVEVCKTCHAPAHSTENCLPCHMWKRRTEDAVHVVMTDHFIQRRKPARDMLAAIEEKPLAYRGEVVAYFPAQAADELYAGVAQVQHESNLSAGIPRLEQALARRKPENPEYYVELGKAQSKSGQRAEAIRWFEEALRHRADFHPALRELAAALAMVGNFARAIEFGERACAQQPPDAVALTNLGNAYLRRGDYAQAKQTLERAIALNPDLPDAWNLLGLAALAEHNESAAETSFRSAIASQPEMAEAHNNLGNLLAGRGDYAQAAWHFQQAIASNPSYADAHHSYGLLLALTRSFDRSLNELRESARLDPNSAQLHADFADALLGSRRAPEAESEYRRAIQLKPELAEAYYGLGNALLAERRLAEALRQFQTAVEQNPNYYEAHLTLGMAMANAGNMAAARPHLEKAAQSDDAAVRQAAVKALR